MEYGVVVMDITKYSADAIVNAANCSLLGGGGVDGAIHRAAGLGLLAECAKLGGCKTGEAKITGGYNLPAKFVIHTPGPIYYMNSEQNAERLLRNCYENSLDLAEANGCETVGFASISTGVYRFPIQKAAEIVAEVFAARAARETPLKRVEMVCFDEKTADAYRAAFSKNVR
ncbi:MAG: macro domain-containing protein [Thermoguttaceae bacterium]|nr:macro domain-containing protein [Thermoguttaceae bacterium]